MYLYLVGGGSTGTVCVTVPTSIFEPKSNFTIYLYFQLVDQMKASST
jgi:hypothetical protein